MLNFAEKALEEVKRYIESLRSRFSLRLVILFGSFAQDSWTEYSDIDVLVVADELSVNIGENFPGLVEGRIEPFGVKSDRFFDEIRSLNFVVLDALETGKILFSDEDFKEKAWKVFEKTKEEMELVREAEGWRWNPEKVENIR